MRQPPTLKNILFTANTFRESKLPLLKEKNPGKKLRTVVYIKRAQRAGYPTFKTTCYAAIRAWAIDHESISQPITITGDYEEVQIMLTWKKESGYSLPEDTQFHVDSFIAAAAKIDSEVVDPPLNEKQLELIAAREQRLKKLAESNAIKELKRAKRPIGVVPQRRTGQAGKYTLDKYDGVFE